MFSDRKSGASTLMAKPSGHPHPCRDLNNQRRTQSPRGPLPKMSVRAGLPSSSLHFDTSSFIGSETPNVLDQPRALAPVGCSDWLGFFCISHAEFVDE